MVKLNKNKEKSENKKNLKTLISSYKIVYEKLIESNEKIKELKAELKSEKSGDLIE